MKTIFHSQLPIFLALLLAISGFSQTVFADSAQAAQPATDTNIFKHYFDCPCPHLIAHRGASGNYPESSLLAFSKALKFNTDILELDVHLSADGHIIVIHDESFLRTTGQNVLVALEKLQNIKQLDAGFNFSNASGEFPFRGKGMEVLTLNEVFDAFAGERFNIEIKPDSETLAIKLAEMITEKNLQDRVVVASKHARALKTFRTHADGVMTSAHRNEVIRAYVQWLVNGDLSNETYHLLQIPHRFTSKSMVQYFQAQGKQVHVWTVNQEKDIRRMLRMGVDGVMTDFPELAFPIYLEKYLRKGNSE